MRKVLKIGNRVTLRFLYCIVKDRLPVAESFDEREGSMETTMGKRCNSAATKERKERGTRSGKRAVKGLRFLLGDDNSLSFSQSLPGMKGYCGTALGDGRVYWIKLS
ncbi:hypothetical protein NPIL_595581 [Nephila pilipes]|uniref:Uncharacterized protein n=1 Tax=Nephila pilipes TaxID=299642 RepID=A0A8X6T8F0_NEPPI|nr:hypothetical protein NPIL_595581 [Nephila pilipes]